MQSEGDVEESYRTCHSIEDGSRGVRLSLMATPDVTVHHDASSRLTAIHAPVCGTFAYGIPTVRENAMALGWRQGAQA